jgi:hypothetical protein
VLSETFEFEAIVCNAWNKIFVTYYINLLVGGIQRKVEIKIDGIL